MQHHYTLRQIARDIRADWKNPNPAAVPYLDAMAQLDKITDHYGADSAYSIVRYFLSNASTWKGPVARDIKRDLRSMIDD